MARLRRAGSMSHEQRRSEFWENTMREYPPTRPMPAGAAGGDARGPHQRPQAGGARVRGQRGAAAWMVIGGTAAAAAALVGGGAYAAMQLSGGGDQPADLLPADTLAYVRVDLDPSASQKVDLIRLLQRVPEFEETTGISSDKEDLRRTAVTSILSEFDCDVDYADDIEPWIGDRAAFAVVPGDDRPSPIGLLQVTDASAAESGLAAVIKCFGGEEAPGAFAFSDDYVVIAESQDVADGVVSGGAEETLADDDAYAEDMDRMGDAGIVSYWADLPAVAKATEQMGDDVGMGLGGMGMGFGGMGMGFGGAETAFGAVRAGSDNIELAAYTSGDQLFENAASPVTELPATTLATFSVSGLGERVPELWDRLREYAGADSGSFDREVAAFERETGLQLPEDLATLLGDNVTVALDSEGLARSTMESGPKPSDYNAGVRFSGDTEAIIDVVDRIRAALLREEVPVQLSTQEVDGGVVVATNDEYAGSMTGQDLAGTDAFQGAVGELDDTAGVFFLDIDSLATIVAEFETGSGGETSFADSLEPMEAFGVNASAEDGYSEARMRLTFDE
jgi:hypothetical protein